MAEHVKKTGWSWPEAPAGPPTRAGRIASVVMTSVFAVYLVEPIRDVFAGPHPPWVRVLVIVDVLVYATLYMAIFPRRKVLAHRSRVVVVAVLFACGLTLAVVLGPDDLAYMTYALSGALILLPPMVGLLAGIGVITALLSARPSPTASRTGTRRRSSRC